ncbi:DUF5020 family protein [Cytophagaceae bacterium DM2B3-1]|uniref:DUF5020 family protein n=1 Tax=Xanthocytophaga flava TaxID=3048013 RepID=A0ABT7CKQ5_9BACT|nr:DUF5020 family protein [Xanthocytophaga flavus]MDJ1494296.1 DUF5020 family protein [Xanthocytophaga flavus]
MKKTFILFLLFKVGLLFSQDLQLHYDFRHSVDPKHNTANFPMISFQYFKDVDTNATGSFLLKVQSFLSGDKNNTGQTFIQISQTLKFWKPKVYFSLNYTGGLGIAPPSFGYYLTNSFGAGISYPFQWKGAWLSANLLYRYNAFHKPSHDPQLTFYLGKFFANYKIFVEGSIVAWTENKDQGIDYTKGQKGKKLAFYGDPQIWFRIKKGFFIGSRISLYYHLVSQDNKVQAYPTIGTKYQF